MVVAAGRRVAAVALCAVVVGAMLCGAASAAAPAGLLVRIAGRTGFEVHNAAGKLVGRVPTGSAVPATSAADSPDGRRIAFVDTDHFLWVVTTDGKQRRRLVHADPTVAPVWSPTARSLAIEAADGRAALVAWPSGGIVETQLPGNRGLVFSRDGWLWSADGDIQAHVQLQGVPPSGSGAPQPFGQPAPDDLFAGSSDALAISPDGQTAAYLRYEGIGSVDEALYEQSRGGAQRALLVGPDFSHSGGHLAFSPDGGTLAVNWTTPKQGLVGQLWLLGAGGGAPRVVALTTDEFAQPAWSPDGQTVAIGLPGGGVALVGRGGAVRKPSGLRNVLDPSWTAGRPTGPPAPGPVSGGCLTSVHITPTIDAIGQCLRKEQGRSAYLSTLPVRVNGIDFVADGGASIVVDVGRRRITAKGSGKEEVRSQLVTLPIGRWRGGLDLDLAGPLRFTALNFPNPKLFGFTMGGDVDAGFTSSGASLHATVSLKVLGDPVTGDVMLATDNKRGLHVDSLDITVGAADVETDPKSRAGRFCSASKDPPKGFDCVGKVAKDGRTLFQLRKQSPAAVRLGGVIPIQGFTLHYDDSMQEWSGGGTIGLGTIFPGANKVLPSLTLKAGVAINPLAFDFGSAQLDNFNLPIGPLDLNKVMLPLRLRPQLEIGGGVGLSVGPKLGDKKAIGVDAGFDFKRGVHSGFDLKVNGTVSVVTINLGSGYVEYDGRDGGNSVTFGGTAGVNFGPVVAQLDLAGTVDSRHFEATGNARLTEFGVGLVGRAVLSDAGFGACGKENQASFHEAIGFRHYFSSGRTEFTGCDFAGLFTVTGAKPHALDVRAAASSHASSVVRLRRGLRGEEFAAVGAAAPPSVTLSGPHGELLQTPATVDRASITPAGFALAESATRTTYFIVERPRAGRWTLSMAPGVATPVRFERADPLSPNLRARLSGRGARRVLHWVFRHEPGETVTFLEQGAAVSRSIVRTSRPRGSARFTPARGPGGRRAIVAAVSVDGVLRSQRRVATFHAAAPRLPSPSSARFRQRRRAVTVTWGGAPGASGYEIDVLLSHRERRRFIVDAGARRLSFGVPPETRVRAVDVHALEHGLVSRGLRARPS